MSSRGVPLDGLKVERTLFHLPQGMRLGKLLCFYDADCCGGTSPITACGGVPLSPILFLTIVSEDDTCGAVNNTWRAVFDGPSGRWVGDPTDPVAGGTWAWSVGCMGDDLRLELSIRWNGSEIVYKVGEPGVDPLYLHWVHVLIQGGPCYGFVDLYLLE